MELRHRSQISFKKVTKSFKEKSSSKIIEVFRDFSIDLPLKANDKIISFVGKSGAGKTTLLRLIAGLELPNNGFVLIDGKLITEKSKIATLVPQQFTCFPWLNIFDNIAFGLELKKSKDINKLVLAISKQLGLDDRLDAYPNELSGGMQQRVAIGRALAVDAPILLLDEPFGSLDAETREEMQNILIDISQKSNKLFCLVTHDINEAIILSDVIYILPTRPIFKITGIIDVKFKHPRSANLIGTSEFYELNKRIKNLL